MAKSAGSYVAAERIVSTPSKLELSEGDKVTHAKLRACGQSDADIARLLAQGSLVAADRR